MNMQLEASRKALFYYMSGGEEACTYRQQPLDNGAFLKRLLLLMS